MDIPLWLPAPQAHSYPLFVLSAAGIAYGLTTGKFMNLKDINKAMVKQMSAMGSYVVFCFFCGQFQALFNWTIWKTLLSIKGAELLREIGFTGLPLSVAFILITALINLLCQVVLPNGPSSRRSLSRCS